MEMARKHKTVMRVRSVSPHLYNCVGMVFANRRAWIEIEALNDIFREDGYTKIMFQQLETGDIVTYAHDSVPTHVGIVTHVERFDGEVSGVTVLSKWGKDAEILYPLSVVPARFGSASEFWSERTPHEIG